MIWPVASKAKDRGFKLRLEPLCFSKYMCEIRFLIFQELKKIY